MKRLFVMLLVGLLPAFAFGQWAQDNAADMLGEAYTRTLYPGMRLADAFGLSSGDTWTTNGLQTGAITLGGSKRTTWPVIGVYAEAMNQGVATTNTPSWTNVFIGGWSAKLYLTRGDTAYGWGDHADAGYLTSIPVLHATNITATGAWPTVQGAIDGLTAATNSYVMTNDTRAVSVGSLAATGNVSAGGSITASATRTLPAATAITNANQTLAASAGSVQRWAMSANVTNVTFTGGGTNTESVISWYIQNPTNNILLPGLTWLDGKSHTYITNNWNLVVIQWFGTNATATYITGGAGSL